MKAKFNYHEDSGHGWLAVKRALIIELGIEVSMFSYQKGGTVYLEEDCDMSEFLKAYRERFPELGEPELIKKYSHHSTIRYYEGYNPSVGYNPARIPFWKAYSS